MEPVFGKSLKFITSFYVTVGSIKRKLYLAFLLTSKSVEEEILNLVALPRKVKALNKNANKEKIEFDWMLTKRKDRKKMGYKKV